MRASPWRLGRHTRFLSVFTAVCALTLSATVPIVHGQDGDSEQDLQGLLPDFVPSGITESDFSELNGSWADWSQETGRLVIEFYSSDDPNVRGRRATLDQLRQRVETMKQALADPQYAGLHPQLADFYSRLAPRVAIMEALLDTIELDLPAQAEQHQAAARSRLVADARALERHLQSIRQGDAWFPYFQVPGVVSAAEEPGGTEHLVALIDDVQTKLEGRTAYTESQRAFLSSEPVLDFEDSLAGVKASLVSQNPAEYRAQIREKAAELLSAIEGYEEEPLSEHTRAIRTAYDDIRRLAPDGGARLTEAMRQFYLNYNAVAMVDESLVQSLFNESRFESGFISDMTNHVDITGCQWTNTRATIDLKPSNEGVRFDLCLRGNIRSRVQGDAHIATVYVAGSHGFNGKKEVFYDGYHFHTRPSRVSVYANNQPTGANTHFSWVPLVGRITEKIAVDAARKQIPDANDRTRQQIYREAKPRFDREAAENFYEAELELDRKVKGPLREQGLYSDVRQFSSTETDMMARTRLMESGELGGGAPFPIAMYASHGVLLQVHESLVNNAAERFELEGKTFTPDELKAYLTERFERLLDRPVDLSKILPSEDEEVDDQPKVEEVIFADEDAVRVQLEGGAVKLYLRIGLNLEGREPIPPQSISIELYPTLVGNMVHVEPGETIGVDAIDPVPPGERGTQIARANVMRAKMQDLFEPQDLDAIRTLDLQEKSLTLQLTNLAIRGGWLSAAMTDGVSDISNSPSGMQAVEPQPFGLPANPAPLPGADPQLAPEAAPTAILPLDLANGAAQKAGEMATAPQFPAPIRR